jgi:uncharacterized SAM-binding protein YcdF (DUF218 family)
MEEAESPPGGESEVAPRTEEAMDDPRQEGRTSGRGMGGAVACRLLGLVGVVLFLATAFTPLPNLLSRYLEMPSHLEPAGAIVVLGAGVEPGGVLSDTSMRRAVEGMVLYRKGLAPLVLFSGPGPAAGPVEAEVRAELARALGISPGAILTEGGAETTREEAVNSGRLLRERGVRRILLVTDSHHMVRAKRLFEMRGFEVLPAATGELSSPVSQPEGRLGLMRRILIEVIARFYYRIAGHV